MADMRFVLTLTGEQHEWLREQSFERKMSMADVVREAITRSSNVPDGEANMEAMIGELERAVTQNEEKCGRILSGRIKEHEAVYMPELPGENCLSDREVYIWHRAFNVGVMAALSTLRQAQEPQKDLLKELFD